VREEPDVAFGTGPEGLEAGKEVGEDLAAFLRAKMSGHTVPVRTSPLEGLLQLLGKEGEELRDQLAKSLDEAWSLGESARAVQSVAEAHENSKGMPLAPDMREALADEDRERAAADSDAGPEDMPLGDSEGPEDGEPVFEDSGAVGPDGNDIKGNNETGNRGFSEEYNSAGTDAPEVFPGEATGVSGPMPRARFRAAKALRRSLADQEPGADAGAFRAVLEQVAVLEAQIRDLKAEVVRSHQTVEDLRPLLEATAIREHILPEAAAGGMVLGGPLLAEDASPTLEGRRTEQGLHPEPSARAGSGIRPSLAVLGVAAALLAGIGIGAALIRRPAVPASRGREALGLAQQLTNSQKVKLRYLREEKRQLEMRLQVEEEARRLVEMRRQELERAAGTQKAGLMQAAERALQEAVTLHDGAVESANRARRALAWVERLGA